MDGLLVCLLGLITMCGSSAKPEWNITSGEREITIKREKCSLFVPLLIKGFSIHKALSNLSSYSDESLEGMLVFWYFKPDTSPTCVFLKFKFLIPYPCDNKLCDIQGEIEDFTTEATTVFNNTEATTVLKNTTKSGASAKLAMPKIPLAIATVTVALAVYLRG